jgi:thermostable 8-oxoguanine DNA glycosylase
MRHEDLVLLISGLKSLLKENKQRFPDKRAAEITHLERMIDSLAHILVLRSQEYLDA